MPPYEWSFEHRAFVKECCNKNCATKSFVGASTEEASIEIFRQNFSPHNGTDDGLQPACMACFQARRRGHNGYDRELKLSLQNGKCAVCGKEVAFDRVPHRVNASVDHNHMTGKARGVLCQRCNTGIGYLEDVEWKEKAMKYLAEWCEE